MFSRPVHVWSLDGFDRSRLVLCSFPCLELYLDVLDPEGEADVNRAQIRAGSGACVYCAGCGGRIAEAPKCMMHADGCPSFSWSGALAMQRLFRDCWLEEVGGEVPEEAWEAAEDVSVADPTLSPAALVAVVLGLFDDL
jgi:hypothetical protein